MVIILNKKWKRNWIKLEIFNNRNWMFALGKDFYERGDQDKVYRIRINEVQMLETFYDHQYGSDLHYIQRAESRETVMQLLFGGKKR